MKKGGALFMGLDSSTQSIKAAVVDASLNMVFEAAVEFDSALPEFKTKGGVHRGKDGLTVTSPALMWVAALDVLLGKMAAKGFDFSRVAAVSGSGQQHGSVYLARGARKALRGLKKGPPLRRQLAGIFAVADSPIWMDSSTGRECREREAALGGPQAVAELTGSRAYERFTGNQIAKVSRTKPAAYARTERICLVSSFVASVLAGDYVPIDASDGSGMNLMDIRSKEWSEAALKITAMGLRKRLGPIAPSHAVAGRINRYFCDTYGFSPDCLLVTFSGDNPCSMAGLMLQKPGELAISLGTSDTVFGSLSRPTPSATEGHIFANPVDPRGYMALICYKNGSLTREHVRDEFGGGSWKSFEKAMAATKPGNNGLIGFYIKDPEITPPLMKTGIYRFDAQGKPVSAFPAGADVRAVVEAQFVSMRLHGANVGLKPTKILATGGASANSSIIRIMSDVFGCPVYRGEQPNSAAAGAAYRALHGHRCERERRFVPFATALRGAPAFKKAASPDMAAHKVYSQMLGRYAELEKTLA